MRTQPKLCNHAVIFFLFFSFSHPGFQTTLCMRYCDHDIYNPQCFHPSPTRIRCCKLSAVCWLCFIYCFIYIYIFKVPLNCRRPSHPSNQFHFTHKWSPMPYRVVPLSIKCVTAAAKRWLSEVTSLVNERTYLETF